MYMYLLEYLKDTHYLKMFAQNGPFCSDFGQIGPPHNPPPLY